MRVHFHGAAGDVTGSMHLVEAAGKRILIDCGLVQGSPEADARNFAPFPFDPKDLDALVLSHAHIDHLGRVPRLCMDGFRGPIFTQRASADLLPIMLMDSASLQENEAERDNRRRKPNQPKAMPLYTREDVREVFSQVRPLPYAQRTEILPGVELVLRDAGHILGSAIVEVFADGRKLVFSGDLGMQGTPILRDPEPVAQADLLLMESTYGDRNHRQRHDTVRELGEILDAAWNDRGNVLIPAFAVGRTQELLYWFARHWDDWDMARWRIFLDSPMASKVVQVYDRHHELFDAEAREVWRGTPNPFRLPNLRVTESAEESMAINRIRGGAIVIAGNGMANGGRILHHMRQNLPHRQTRIIFVGYQAQGTIGRRLVEGARWVRIHGHDVRVNAHRHTVGGLSAHADQAALLNWYAGFQPSPPVALVHGEDLAREALAGEIHERHGVEAVLVRPGDVLEV
ncbi:MAG: MBL fold metallo-hydrolase [Thermomonas sp.]|uniref:MBL fold metallo-hydrolase RNA specificity domain-containing protein n=1 Tax=Thermomonas sp. TaxID=1971895 RepID=UPI001DD5668D|nr:MBL fold metallo-hydrolase [Thermomonas sp.]MBZ0087018.1 MBL fold metallo-hydrolase [Thermomonas sp.]MCO5054953.1 MBL fold metallo-hydrolase [Thermomonas sp.]